MIITAKKMLYTPNTNVANAGFVSTKTWTAGSPFLTLPYTIAVCGINHPPASFFNGQDYFGIFGADSNGYADRISLMGSGYSPAMAITARTSWNSSYSEASSGIGILGGDGTRNPTPWRTVGVFRTVSYRHCYAWNGFEYGFGTDTTSYADTVTSYTNGHKLNISCRNPDNIDIPVGKNIWGAIWDGELTEQESKKIIFGQVKPWKVRPGRLAAFITMDNIREGLLYDYIQNIEFVARGTGADHSFVINTDNISSKWGRGQDIFIPGKPVVASADQGVHASEFIEAGIDANFAKYTPEEGENRLVVVYINLERSDNASGALIGNGITSVTIGGVEATQVVHNQVKVPEGANYRGTVSYIGYIKEADIKSGNMYIKYTEDSSPNLEGSAVYCQTLFNVDQTNPVYSIASGGPGEPFTLTIPTIKGGYLVATHSEIQSTAKYTFSNLIDKWSAVSTNGLMSTSGAAASSQDGVVNITITETTAVGTATANSGVAANFRPVDTTFNHAVRVR